MAAQVTWYPSPAEIEPDLPGGQLVRGHVVPRPSAWHVNDPDNRIDEAFACFAECVPDSLVCDGEDEPEPAVAADVPPT